MHLLLKRHLEVLRIGQIKILHMEELSTHSDSLYFALNVFEYRMNELQSGCSLLVKAALCVSQFISEIFKPTHREPFVQFENFAYGMV